MPLDTGGSVAVLVFGPEIQLSLVSRSWTTVAAASPPPINFTFRVWGLGCPDSRAIMLGFRASRIGLLILKQLTRDKSICRPTYATRSFTQFLQPLYNQQSGTRLFRGAIFQKHHHFSTTTASTSDQGTEQKETISVTFVDKDGDEKHIKVPIGMSMLEAAHENDIELEGACEGSLACSTCHVIVMEMEYYNKLEDPTDEENDMLDLAFGLTETSRLGCQVIASPELDGVRLAIPAATRNFAVDGYVPKPH